MFIVTNSIVWSVIYFFSIIYILFTFYLVFYFIPVTKDLLNFFKKKTNITFDYLNGFDLFPIIATPSLIIFFIMNSWSHYLILTWFSHLVFGAFQLKMSYFVILLFYFIMYVNTSVFYFSSREIFDYVLTLFNFFFWVLFLFYINNLFTFFFFIEVLGTLIFLMIITSSFSTTYFYNNLNYNLYSYFNNNTPFFFVQTLLYFFWISLISSLNLFFFSILFFLKFFSFDWFLVEFIFSYFVQINNFSDYTAFSLIWFNLMFTLFLKCGLVPFFFWKPVFFKSIPLHALFFYICFFYFFLFLFLLYFLLIYFNELFVFFSFINILFALIGVMFLLVLICESFYLKIFLALSSILNSIFVLFSLISTISEDIIFFL